MIRIRGARQHNLKNLDLDLPLNELVVVTGVSGSGKSSLVFDTLYAEGQRRYVETFSPYARQFLDRMDKPQVERIEGVPPAIAIDQVNPIRTSRSTVGTMTEINDHLKLLYARAGVLHCRNCGKPVRRDDPDSIYASLQEHTAARGDPRLLICFSVAIPKGLTGAQIKVELGTQGYTRIHEETKEALTVIQDRLRLGNAGRGRVIEALEAALHAGRERLKVLALNDAGADAGADAGTDAASAAGTPAVVAEWNYSRGLHCAECDLLYHDATPGLFSFNSPVGACETCKGFGRVIGVDYSLVIPDENKSLAEGAVRPWQTPSFKECQDDVMRHAKRRGIDVDTPWKKLPQTARDWVIDGEGPWTRKQWYGIKRYFAWLESKAYKMHIRVLLSKYRSYTECPTCHGSRLKPDALLWKLGPYNVHELALLPLDKTRAFIDGLRLSGPLDEASDLVLRELRARLSYLGEVGLGYLTLDRQSRTLSGGEVQRINLTTALGTSLVNTLFVLDEPSIGLHPRDMGRVVRVMHRLRDAGNSLLVVEHDPQIMQHADRILDLGPGAGERGGEIVAWGTPAEVAATPKSLTGAWLSGRKQLPAVRDAKRALADKGEIRVEGVAAHNLKNVDIAIPLGRLVCVTGVSGSGKSTLIEEVLFPAMQKAAGKGTEAPLEHKRLVGAELVESAVLVDQTSIGRTTRSNPASYVGAFDCIRKLFAATPDAKLRRYTSGTFSFNSGTGRCPVCRGNGFEHIEMQFLSDVYLRCGECDGRRYRAETLQVKLEGSNGGSASIADVLDMTVSGALVFFAKMPEVLRRLQPLGDVGLEYLKLGQPVPTLSGGEAQRLKLAGHLAEAQLHKPTRGKLLLFDEPTTGLHFEDITRLIGAFRQLLEAGHSLLVIEHNLDVIRASDWVIDLGPDAGEAGGELVFAGTPEALQRCKGSHTGHELAAYLKTLASPGAGMKLARVAEPAPTPSPYIAVRGAREHNLRDIDVDIPRDKFTVITGVSGSGKSTLAFDIVFNEGQRRYLESLNAYARQFVQPASRPDIDAVLGIPPTVAIEQRTSRGGLKSTVATLTEVYHFLRLLYTKLGTQYCPDCHIPIAPQSSGEITAQLLRKHRGAHVQLLAPLVAQRKGIYTDLARWAGARGVRQLRVDGKMVPTRPFPKLKRFVEHTIEMPVAELKLGKTSAGELETALLAALEHGKGIAHVLLDDGTVEVHSTLRACPNCHRGFPEPDPRMMSFNSPQGWCTSCHGTGLSIGEFDAEQTGEESVWRELGADSAVCPDCNGERLNPVARNLQFAGRSMAALTALPAAKLQQLLAKQKLDPRARAIGKDALEEIDGRLGFLDRVGLGYLSLDRAAPTLSGGEAQRIRLAAQLGSNLRGVCYVLDEPTIGLHPRDNRLLLEALDLLARQQNTLIVVEHDEDTIRRADHVIDLGPGAGARGGLVVASGTAKQLAAQPQSITGRFLKNPLTHSLQPRRPVTKVTPLLNLRGVSLHNLAKLDVAVPVGRLVVITGVSGSGKSTLARDVLYTNLHRQLGRKGKIVPLTGLAALTGLVNIDRVLEVDQTPIGRTPRSCPGTYVGFWDEIRRVFAGGVEAKLRGWGASRFSFNTAGGRCTQCEGQGVRTIEMNFLPDVKVLCDKCSGLRFDEETLQITWRGKTISDVLALSVDDAVEFFAAHPRIRRSLELLRDVGLGYLTLGQASPTLSGGEAQRIKLVTELATLGAMPRGATRAPHTLYVLDEPTVGLHMADVEKLLQVLHRLVDAGHSVVMVEHNLDVMAEADWIIDLGPEAGDGGGKLVAEGTPAQVMKLARRSHTGAALVEFMKDRTRE